MTYGKLVNTKVKVTDIQWHDVSLVISATSAVLTVDGSASALNDSSVAHFLDFLLVSSLVVGEKFEGTEDNSSPVASFSDMRGDYQSLPAVL